MPRQRRGLLWVAFCAVLALAAGVATPVDPGLLNWQPALAWREPWRWWSAALVHLSSGHLLANLAGCAVLAVFGWAAGCNRRDTLAWGAAWPLTHLLLLAQPELQRYGGLSGLLHAGVVVAALGVALRERGRARAIGLAVLAGVTIKIALERPWAGAVQAWPGWDIPVAPFAHAAGAMAGLLCAAVAWATSRRRAVATMPG